MSMKIPTVVTGVSNNDYYLECERNFRKMFLMNAHNKLIVERYEDCGNWHDNTRKKPQIILKLLEQEKNTIMWIDVDAEIHNRIELNIPSDIDMMATKQEWGPRRTWCVGTLVFNYTENAINFLKDWIESCENGSGTDEAHLDVIWNRKWSKILRTKTLPAKFFVVEKLHPKSHDTVILHKSSGNARKVVK